MFAFAADTSAIPPEGAAPYAVQARQLPRLLVAHLNAEPSGDAAVRFFPFMGVVDERRQFFDIGERFSPDQLRRFHGQDGITLLIDGELSEDSISMRVIEAAEGGRKRLELTMDYDPADPWPAMRRLMFEITGVIGWQGAVPELPSWTGPTLGWYLIAKDELLAVEASMPTEDAAQRLRAAREAYDCAPRDEVVARVLLETCRALVLEGKDVDTVSGILLDSLEKFDNMPPSVIADAARVIEASQGISAAIPLYVRVARRAPQHPEVAVKAGFGLHAMGRTDDARKLLRDAFEAGNRDVELRAQLAAAEEECGNTEERDRLIEGLISAPELPVPVARLVASFLIDRERGSEALVLLDRARLHGASHAGMWLERGRALLSVSRPDDARRAFERCLAHRGSAEVRSEARRLLRLAGDGVLLPDIREIESALRLGDLSLALRRARTLVRQRPELAEAHLLLGIVRQRMGHDRRAIVSFRRAIKLQADLADAHNRLGVLLLARGQSKEGYEHLVQATELAPNDAGPWVHFAQACRSVGRDDEARLALDRAERIGGRDAEVNALRRMFGESA